MKYPMKKKQVLPMLLAAVLACPPVCAQAVTFADLDQVPWSGAETSINKAAGLGLVVGETRNGKSYFKPKDAVSLAESCQFTYKVMIQTGKASADSSVTEKWAAVLNSYKIQSWAHTAVAYCLENGIISISDLSGFVSGSSNKAATREQAAEMFGRALAVGNPSLKATATATKFYDNASISADARPYIALLNTQGIVNGDDTNHFNPKSTLNRTETAVMVTNLYEALKNTASTVTPTPSASTKSGKVADMSSFYVNLENTTAYYLFSANGATLTLNGKTTTATELATLFKNGSTLNATLTLDSTSRITKMVVTAESTDTETDKPTKGTLTGVTYDEDDNDGSIKLDKKYTYTIKDADDVSIKIDGKTYDLEELDEYLDECDDDDITIKVTLTLDSKGKLTKIVGTTDDDDDDDDDDNPSGKVTSLSSKSDDSGSIKIGSKKYNIKDIDDVSIKLDKKTVDFDDLEEAYEDLDDDEIMKATLTLDKKDYVTKIVASIVDEDDDDDDDDDEAKGTIASITDKKIKVGSKTYSIDDPDVDIDDGDDSIDDYDDLIEAVKKDNKTIQVELKLKKNKVTDIEGYVSSVKGELTNVKKNSKDEYTLTVKGGSSSSKYVYDDKETAEIVSINKMSGVETMEDLYDWWDDDDSDEYEVTVTITLDKDGSIKKVSGKLK